MEFTDCKNVKQTKNSNTVSFKEPFQETAFNGNKNEGENFEGSQSLKKTKFYSTYENGTTYNIGTETLKDMFGLDPLMTRGKELVKKK